MTTPNGRFSAAKRDLLARCEQHVETIRPRVLGQRIRVSTGVNASFTGVIVDVQPGPLRYTASTIYGTFRVTVESTLKTRETFTLKYIPRPLRESAK